MSKESDQIRMRAFNCRSHVLTITFLVDISSDYECGSLALSLEIRVAIEIEIGHLTYKYYIYEKRCQL